MAAESTVTNSIFEKSMGALYELLEKRFGEMSRQFRIINTRFQTLTDGQDTLFKITQDIQSRVSHLEYSMEDALDNLATLTEAEGKGAIATINHDLRISALENVVALCRIHPFIYR